MQRMFNLSKWAELGEGQSIWFPSTRPRVVRMDVNAPGDARLYVVQEGGEPAFLARVVGRDVLEFFVEGAFGLVTEGSTVNVYTIDGDNWAYEDPDPIVFTRVTERRPRNLELEYITMMMSQNVEKRLASQAREMERRFEQRLASVRVPQSSSGPPASRAGAENDASGGDAPASDTGRRDDEA